MSLIQEQAMGLARYLFEPAGCDYLQQIYNYNTYNYNNEVCHETSF